MTIHKIYASTPTLNPSSLGEFDNTQYMMNTTPVECEYDCECGCECISISSCFICQILPISVAMSGEVSTPVQIGVPTWHTT